MYGIGAFDGMALIVGDVLGLALGTSVGDIVGYSVGLTVGVTVGLVVVGLSVGLSVVGLSVGVIVGWRQHIPSASRMVSHSSLSDSIKDAVNARSAHVVLSSMVGRMTSSINGMPS